LERIAAIARAQGTSARVALRVNPDIDALSHPHISTGLRTNKFGVPLEQARDLYLKLRHDPWLQPVGVHVHVGSQIVSLEPLITAARALVGLATSLRHDGIALQHVDLGGGLGISYDGKPVPSIADYAAAILPVLAGSGLALLLEPGRALVGPAGVLLATVVDVKDTPGGTRFVVLDTGMTELIRPALYGAYHRIEPVVLRRGDERPVDVVGPVCESSDVLGRQRPLPPLEVGDLVAIRDAGAYGAVMASNYNRRPLPAEVLVEAGEWRVVRRRQTVDDMIAFEE
jgi:diaminopimelate decarboxylase